MVDGKDICSVECWVVHFENMMVLSMVAQLVVHMVEMMVSAMEI
jgi:hypothetical protein